MSIEKDILKYLRENKNKKVLKYKGMRIGFLGLPDFKHYKYQTLINGYSHLKLKGYVKDINGTQVITVLGEKFLKSKDKGVFKKFSTEKTDDDPKDLLIIYDIPDSQTSARNWFRRELRQFHFIMIQRSVWVGPSPLPQDFIKYVKDIKLQENFKTFKLSKGYLSK